MKPLASRHGGQGAGARYSENGPLLCAAVVHGSASLKSIYPIFIKLNSTGNARDNISYTGENNARRRKVFSSAELWTLIVARMAL